MKRTLKRIRNNSCKFGGKVFIGILCWTMILINIDIRNFKNVVKAETEKKTLNILNTQFVTKEEIIELCESTNDGVGLLATGTDSDVKLRVNFGKRNDNVKFFKDVANYSEWKNNHGQPTEVESGTMVWNITGKEDDERVVLYVEEPMMGAKKFGGKLVFQEKNTSQEYLVSSEKNQSVQVDAI